MVLQSGEKCYIVFGDFMELYYKNETLFVDVDVVLNEENFHLLKRRVFRIVDDYDIDRIVFRVLQDSHSTNRLLKRMEAEYHQKYQGSILIK